MFKRLRFSRSLALALLVLALHGVVGYGLLTPVVWHTSGEPTHDTVQAQLLSEPATPRPRAVRKPAAPQPPLVPPTDSPNALLTTPANPDATDGVQASDATAPASTPATPATALNWPASRELTYTATGFSKGLNYYATAHLTWTIASEHYSCQWVVRAFLLGSRAQVSKGRVTPQGLQPETYYNPAHADQVTQFSHDTQRITFGDNGEQTPLLEGAQDRLSVIFQIGALLAQSPAGLDTAAALSFQTASTSGADVWQFMSQGTETLHLPYGDLDTIKVQRVPRRPDDQRIEIWYAPAFDYLPVRLKITQASGDFMDQSLKDIENPSP